MRRPLAVLLAAGLGLSCLSLVPAAAAEPTGAGGIRPAGPAPRAVVRAREASGTPSVTLPVDRTGRALATSDAAPGGPRAATPGRANRLSATALSTWDVTYGPGFSGKPEAQAAFQRAVDTWSRAVVSTVTIRVVADLKSDLGTDVLGSAGPTALCTDSTGIVYPEVLLNARTGRDNDTACGNVAANQSDGSDITAQFTTEDLFYYGADPAGIAGATCAGSSSGCFDFESLVLHELGHGLGFLGSAQVDDNEVASLSDDPYVFDVFVKLADGRYVVDLPNGSSTLYSALTSQRLFWDGAQGSSADHGREPMLYAPNDGTVPGSTRRGFLNGSSFTHLDEDSYPSTDPDTLMTPYAEPKEVTRDPGEVTLGMFRDMGWVTPGLPGSRFTAVTPTRIYDSGSRGVVDKAVKEISTRTYGVPAAATAVVLNLTSDRPTATNVVRAYPTGRRPVFAPVPLVSHVNTARSDTRANLVTVPTGRNGTVRVLSNGGSTRVIADLMGYYAPDATATDAGFALASSTTRVLDTRSGTGAPLAKVGPGGTVDLQMTGVAGVPAGASAVTLTVTAVGPTAATYVSVFPTGTSPATSNLNLPARATAANQVIVKVGTGGKVSLRNAFGDVDLVADLIGWYDPSAGDGEFRPTLPVRLLDTRPGSPIAAGGSVAVNVASSTVGAGVPSNATSVVTNLTGVGPTTATYLTAFPFGTAFPGTSNLNLSRGQTAAAHSTVALGSSRVRVRNNAGSVDALLDVFGWFGPA